MPKVQSQLLVSPITRDRADALALVRSEPRAEIYRMALEGAGLAGLEATHAGALAALDEVAAGMKMTRSELVRKATDDGLTLADLEGRKRYPRKA